MITNDEKLGAIYKNGTIGYTPKIFYKFLTEDIDSKDVLIIHYFILSGLWGCAKIQIQVDHILYTWNSSHNKNLIMVKVNDTFYTHQNSSINVFTWIS